MTAVTTVNRHVTRSLCALALGAGLALGVATGAEASPVTTPTAPSPVWEVDPTPLVVQARDYPVIMTITSGPRAGHQQRIAARAHEVFPTSPDVGGSITFSFDGVPHSQTYEIDPDRIMRFDMQGSARFPAVTLRQG